MRPALTRWLHVVMVMGLSGLSRAASLPLLLVFAQGGFFWGGGGGRRGGFSSPKAWFDFLPCWLRPSYSPPLFFFF